MSYLIGSTGYKKNDECKFLTNQILKYNFFKKIKTQKDHKVTKRKQKEGRTYLR
jgi:hypothetical protein